MQGTQYAHRESILCMEHFVALLQWYLIVSIPDLSTLTYFAKSHIILSFYLSPHIVPLFRVSKKFNNTHAIATIYMLQNKSA